MPAKLSPPVMQEFRLEQLDERLGIPEAEATKVTFLLATVAQNTLRSTLFEEVIQELSAAGEPERRIFRFKFYALSAKEVYLTLVGCNMTTEDGVKPLFRFKNGPRRPFLDMTEKEFVEAWGLLDDDTAAEIHDKCLALNTHWAFGATVEGAGLGE